MKRFVLLVFVSMFLLSANLPLARESKSSYFPIIQLEPLVCDYFNCHYPFNVTVGDTFVVNATITNVADLSSFELYLRYNTTILDALGVWVPPPFEAPPIYEPQIIDPDGYVHVTAISPIPFSGSGPLASITFNATAVGISGLDLYNTTLFDSTGNPMDHAVLSHGYVTVSPVTVPDDYPTIQEAINAASDGATIFVRADTYYERVTVNKSVSLIGEDRNTTIIDGSGKGTVVSVTADNVTINGFTMQNSGKNGYWSFLAGIYLHSSNNEITGNTLLNNNYGIIFGGENTISGNNVQNNNWGIYGGGRKNTISNNTVSDNQRCGIWFVGLWGNDSNAVTGNIVSNSSCGIGLCGWIPLGGATSLDFRTNILQSSSDLPSAPLSNNTVSGNIVTSCGYGIDINGIDTELCNGNTVITGNTITSNNVGLSIISSMYISNNTIYHNNFIGNQLQVSLGNLLNNIWDNGYPSGGNYWGDYNGTDTNQNGIGDTSYEIDVDNTDNYPLMGMFSDFSVTHQKETYHVTTICNSTISEFQFNDVAKTISFNVTDKDGTSGFCRVTIPNIIIQDLWQDNYTVLVDGKEPTTMNNWTDGTYTYIYFTYLHSTHKVEIIPEFPTWTSMLLMLVMLTVAIAVYKRRLLKQF